MGRDATLNIYFAGDLFTHKDLAGNALLAEAIADISDHRFCSVLPQNFPERSKSPRRIRDDKLLTLLECDLALFNFDGTDFENGSVAEFMTAKFADMPTVILRTDYRGCCAQENRLPKWSMMVNDFPRTEVEVVDAAAIYEAVFAEFPMTEAREVLIEERSSEVSRTMVRVIAQAVVDAFDRALNAGPVMREDEAPFIFRWLARFWGPGLGDAAAEKLLARALERKRARGLLRKPAAEEAVAGG